MGRSPLLLIVVTTASLTSAAMQAQGTLVESNLDAVPTGSAPVGSDSWVAQTFTILLSDSNQYTLDSIQLRLSPSGGSPTEFKVSLCSSTTRPPEDLLGTLTGPTDPSAGGIYNYLSSGITLSPGITYSVVVTSATPIAQGAYLWSASPSTGDPTNSWVIPDVHFTSPDGSSWNPHVRSGEVFQMAIYATVVPEPGTAALLGLSLISFWFCRHRLFTSV